MNFERTPEQNAIVEAVSQLCSDFGPDYWAGLDQRHEISRGVSPGDGGRGLARHRHAGAVRRRGARHHRGGADHADRVGVRGGHVSGASAIHMTVFGLQPVVVFGIEAPAGELRPAAADRRAGEGLLRRDRARRGARHHPAQDPGGAQRDGGAIAWMAARSGSRRRRWPRACCCWRAPRRWRQVKPSPQGLTLFYTALDRTQRRGARDPQDGPARGRLEHAVHRRA